MRTPFLFGGILMSVAVLAVTVHGQEAITLGDVDAALPTLAAKVNNAEILTSRLERALAAVLRQNSATPPTDEQLLTLRHSLLERLVGIELLYQKAKSAPYPGLDEDVQAQIDQTKARVGDEDRFNKLLEANGITLEQLRLEMSKDLVIRNYIDTQIRTTIEVTDEDISTFYDENLDKMAQPERARARHILLRVTPEMADEEKAKVREELEGIRKAIVDGGDFAALAEEHSVDISSAQRGGDLGYFTRGQMVAPFEEAAFSLPVGEVSDVVETQFGFHILKVEDRQESRTIPLEEVKDKIKSALENEKAAEKTDAMVQDLKSLAKVEILDPDVLKFLAMQAEQEAVPEAPPAAPAGE